MFDVIFYKYSGMPNSINKKLDNGFSIQCNFNIEYNLINPTIKIVADSFVYNYVYISSLSRYYFIDNVTIIRNRYFELKLSLDVLQTYKDFILNLYGVVTQSKNAFYLKGVNFPVTEKMKSVVYKFPNNPYNKEGNIILIATGGK